MLYVFLSWAYVFFCASVAGTAINEAFKLKNNFVFTQLLGFFGIAVFAAYFAIFYKIGIVFHGCLLVVLFFALLKFKKSFNNHLREFRKGFSEMDLFSKIGFLLVSILVLAQCASPPYVLDNETYYIQTIKWLNEFGYVPGLGNLHIFFGQTSGWHILQSVFNLSFLYDNFNDLSGYCLLLMNFFAFQKLSLSFSSEKHRTLNLAIGIFPLGNILFFQFISAPSPDLPAMVLCFLIFYLLLKKYPDYSKSDFITICFLCFFALFIKTINLFLVAVPLYVYFKSRKNLKTRLGTAFFVGLVTLAVMLIKNQVLTGYALFPMNLIHFNVDYAIPPELMEHIHESTKFNAYLIPYDQYAAMNVWGRFLLWLQLPGLNAIFNKAMVLLLLALPFFLRMAKFRKPLSFVYILALANMAVLFLTSPQYRFFLVFILFFVGMISAHLFQRENLVKILHASSILMLALLLFVPLRFESFTENPLMLNGSSFEPNYLITPHGNSQYSFDFKNVQEGNLEYHSPPKGTYFWVTGDGELPCANKKQIDLFKRKYHFVPQLRGDNLGEGFYPKPTKPWEK